jgi:phosphoglycerate dehydrogenase-like enzyme
MNIAIVDYARIAADADFPLLKTTLDYRWSQYPALDPARVLEDCWRTHVLVTVACPISAETLAGLPKLEYVIIASDERGLVDDAAAAARGIRIVRIPGTASLAPAALCQAIVDELDALAAGRSGR